MFPYSTLVVFIITLVTSVNASEEKTLRCHTGIIVSIAFSPDGKYLASASHDKTAILWDVKEGKKWKTLKGHTQGVECIRFANDGKTVATCSGDRSIRIWDVHTGNQLAILKGHSDIVNSIDYSPDGKLLVSCSNHEIRLWNVKTKNEIRITNASDQINCIAFSPTGKMLATGTGGLFSGSGEVILWDAKTLSENIRLKEHKGAVVCLAYSADGFTLASGAADSAVIVWDIKSGQKSYKKSMGIDVVNSLSIAKNGRLAAGGGFLYTPYISIWNSKSRRSVSVPNYWTDGIGSLAISPNGECIAIAKGNKILIRLLVDNP